MIKFNVQKMSCGHCVKSITEALEAIDPAVEVEADLEAGTVDVDTDVEMEDARNAIEGAGFPASVA